MVFTERSGAVISRRLNIHSPMVFKAVSKRRKPVKKEALMKRLLESQYFTDIPYSSLGPQYQFQLVIETQIPHSTNNQKWGSGAGGKKYCTCAHQLAKKHYE